MVGNTKADTRTLSLFKIISINDLLTRSVHFPALRGGNFYFVEKLPGALALTRVSPPGQDESRRGPRRTSADRPQPSPLRRQRDSCSRVAVQVRPSRAGVLGRPRPRRGRRPR